MSIMATNVVRKVAVAEPLKVTATAMMDIATSSLTRRAGAWAADGFKVGMHIWISGFAGPWTIDSFGNSAFGAGTVLNLAGAALTPQANVSMTVFAYEETLSGGVRIGGDTIVVTGGAGPDSPLVVYGDTSQDGVWYSGHTFDVLGYEFGEKPFDPFTGLTDGENEDDEWVFPLADPFRHHGNDIIDARALFAGADLPSVGFTAYGGAGNDTIYGSQTGDHLAGGSGDDLIYGQRGVDHIYGDSGFNVDILTRALSTATVNESPRPTIDLARIRFINNGTTIEPAPSPVADPLNAGRDTIYGDGPGSASGIQGDFDDVIFGDHGVVIQQVVDPNLPDPRPQKIQTTTLASLRRIESRALQNGNDDVIFGNLDRDIIVGGPGNDLLDGDEQDDFVFGDNAHLLRRINEATLATDTSSPRFQTLAAELIYSRSDLAPSPSADSSGQLLVDGVGRNYRDPDGAPWWADYVVTNLFHNFAFDQGLAGVGSFGNDYIAGSQGHDILLGQLGNDVMQGDGGSEGAFAAISHVGASRTAAPPIDPIGPLTVVPSFEALTDGEDWIEGNGGDDVIFGGLGQDDILGGSSDFFSLNEPSKRPDGDDYIFGGAGIQIERNDEGLALGVTPAERHARDADTIVGDNGQIIRIVGINHQDVAPTALYVTFNYDTYGPLKIVVRGVTLLDYTPGGPDFRPDLFGAGSFGVGSLRAVVDIGGHDEIHGETGDDTAYGASGDDRFFGDAEEDELIGGWGHDWFSGGTGQDAVLGDDGRIFTSRNSATFGEPLFGIAALLATDPDTRTSQGNVLNEFVYSPGHVQTATINVANALKKVFDITPYNLTPNALGDDDPLFRTSYSDDIIFGGLGDDFLHGASGDDAILGAEAQPESYSQRYENGVLVGIFRTDFTRPWNPGNILHFGPDSDAWHSNGHIADRLGEFALYDEFDPRRTILLNTAGGAVKDGIGLWWFLNFDHTEGPALPGGVTDRGVPYPGANTDGDDVIFGDLGNDWSVGGTGKDTIWGGWGNDLSNADDILTTGVPVEGRIHSNKIQPSPNDTPDTHPSYEDRVYGGAGLDVLIGNTGGDRLIDWVGEFNSYIVPFAPFGIATVSRQRPPALDEFLYALSQSQGADPTRATDTGNDAFRNGEPDGEAGMVTQKDHGLWQEQTGGPSDPQPGNVPGGKRDVLRTAEFDPTAAATSFAVDSGNWKVSNARYEATAGNQSDAVSLMLLDDFLPYYFEIEAILNANNAKTGMKSNAYLVFDYQSATDFKYAGLDVDTGRLVIGQRTSAGWTELADASTHLDAFTDYAVKVVINGAKVSIALHGNNSVDYTFDDLLNSGMLGLGTHGAASRFDDVRVLVLPDVLVADGQSAAAVDVQRDVLTGVNFDPNTPDSFIPKSGTWKLTNSTYEAAPVAAGDAISVLPVEYGLPQYSEVVVTFNANRAKQGVKSNAYIIFDYRSATDFKYAGVDTALGKLQIGKRTAAGWVDLVQTNTTAAAGIDTSLKLTLNGDTASVQVGSGAPIFYTFGTALNTGFIGLGTNNSVTRFDNLNVLVLAPPTPLSIDENFNGTLGVPTFNETGSWTIADGRFVGSLSAGADNAITTWSLTAGASPALRLEATVNTLAFGGFIFDYQDEFNFKFAALFGPTHQIAIGHRNASGWNIDAVVQDPVAVGSDHELAVIVGASTVTMLVNGQTVLNWTQSTLLTDGLLGFFTLKGSTTFDDLVVRAFVP
jgi:Ca2+-binding RTX toxin-like protein